MGIRSRNKKGDRDSSLQRSKSNLGSEDRELDPTKKIIGTGSDEFSFIELLIFTIILPIATTFLGTNTYHYGPKLLEPIMGNFFPTYFYLPFIYGFLGFGGLLGVIFQRKFLNKLSANLSITSLFISLSSVYLGLISNYSLKLGPYFTTHLFYLIPVYIPIAICAWINVSLFIKNISFWKYTDTSLHAITLVVVHLAILVIGFGIFSHFPTIETITRLSCYGNLLNALTGAILVYFLNFTLLQNARPAIVDKILMPSLIIMIILFTMSRVPQCQVDASLHRNFVTGFKTLDRQESITGWVSVSEDESRKCKVMRSGHSILGGIYNDYGESIFSSFYYFEAVRFVERPKPQRRPKALQIGLGVGVSTKSLIESGVDVDVVELDPVVYDYAVKYFNLPEPRKIFIEDGRKFLEEKAGKGQYDYLLHDVFTGGTVPESLFSVEALELCKQALMPDGVLVLNFVGGILPPYDSSFEAVTATLRAVFPNIRTYTEEYKTEQDLGNLINLVYFASNKPIKFNIPEKFDPYSQRDLSLQAMTSYEVDLTKYASSVMSSPTLNAARAHPSVMTDKYNILNSLQQPSAYVHWHKMKELFPLEYWIKY